MLQNVLPSILLSIFSSLLPLIVYKSDSAFIPHWTKLAACFSIALSLHYYQATYYYHCCCCYYYHAVKQKHSRTYPAKLIDLYSKTLLSF